MQQRDILTMREVATEYPFGIRTLKYWRNTDRGPASFVAGRRVLYRRAEIERFLAEQEAETSKGGAA